MLEAPDTLRALPAPAADEDQSGQQSASKPVESDGLLWKLAKRWGFSCSSPVDVGILECSISPHRVRVQDLAKDWGCENASCGNSKHDFTIVSQLNCHSAPSPVAVCCAPDPDQAIPEQLTLFAPCMVCAMRPSCIVEVPCGHVNVCAECHRDYHTNTRCLRCRERVPVRIDVSNFLDEITGRPDECKMCKVELASVVMLPCIHMGFCERCLPKSVAGCPSCGQMVQQMCTALWSTERLSSERGLKSFKSLPASSSAALPGLARETEDVDDEIARLEAAMSHLRNVRHESTSASSCERAPGVATDMATPSQRRPVARVAELQRPPEPFAASPPQREPPREAAGDVHAQLAAQLRR